MSKGVRVQGTAVAVDGRGVMLTGAAGCGKSGLALQLIAGGALLIGDDAVEVRLDGGRITGEPVTGRAGRIFVAGIGPATVPATAGPVPLALCVQFDPAALRSDRLPALDAWQALPGGWLPRIALDVGIATADKVRLALRLWGH